MTHTYQGCESAHEDQNDSKKIFDESFCARLLCIKKKFEQLNRLDRGTAPDARADAARAM
jgi:hypothetical protein